MLLNLEYWVALTVLKRFESNRLNVRDNTRDQMRRALESAGILFIGSARGEGGDARGFGARRLTLNAMVGALTVHIEPGPKHETEWL